MKIYLTDQSKRFAHHLSSLKEKPVMPYDLNRLSEKVSTIIFSQGELNASALFSYQIFPSNIMTFLTQWDAEQRSMQVGDTIVQQVFIPPVKSLSQKIIFGVRVNNIIDEPHKKGFSYETLEGHVEKGISNFTIERSEKTTICKIHTFSAPGNLLTKAVGPFFSIPYQRYSTDKALMHVKQQLENFNSSL